MPPNLRYVVLIENIFIATLQNWISSTGLQSCTPWNNPKSSHFPMPFQQSMCLKCKLKDSTPEHPILQNLFCFTYTQTPKPILLRPSLPPSHTLHGHGQWKNKGNTLMLRSRHWAHGYLPLSKNFSAAASHRLKTQRHSTLRGL